MAGLEQQLQLPGVVGIRGSDVFEVAAIGLGYEPLKGGRSLGAAAHHRAIGTAGVELHLKTLKQ